MKFSVQVKVILNEKLFCEHQQFPGLEMLQISDTELVVAVFELCQFEILWLSSVTDMLIVWWLLVITSIW